MYKNIVLDNFEQYAIDADIYTSSNGYWSVAGAGPFTAKFFDGSMQGYVNGDGSGWGAILNLNVAGTRVTHELIKQWKRVVPARFILRITAEVLPTGGIFYVFNARNVYEGSGTPGSEFIRVYCTSTGDLGVYDNLTQTTIITGLFADYKQHVIEVVIPDVNGFYLIVDGKRYTKAGGNYTNYNNIPIYDFEPINKIRIYSGTGVTSARFYVDDFVQKIPNAGFQIQNWDYLADFPTGIAGPSLSRKPFHQHYHFLNEDTTPDKIARRFIYIPTSDGKVYRFNEGIPETWEEVFTTGGVTYDDYVGFHGRRYSGLSTSAFESHVNYWYFHVRHDTTNNKDVIFRSTNNGDTYTVYDSPSGNATMRIICIATSVDSNLATAFYAWILYSGVSPYTVFTELRQYTWTTGTPPVWNLSWTIDLVATLGKTITMNSPYPPPAIGVFARQPNADPSFSTAYVVFCTFTGENYTSVVEVTGGTPTLYHTFPTGEKLVEPVHQLPAQMYLEMNNQVIYLCLSTGTGYKTYKSAYGSLGTWALVNNEKTEMAQEPRWGYKITSYRDPRYATRYMQVDVTSKTCWYLTEKSRLPLFSLPDTFTGTITGLSISGIAVNDAKQIFWYRPTPDQDIIKLASIIKTQIKQTFCHMIVNPDFVSILLFSSEKWIEIYDGLNTLVFYGRALNPTESRDNKAFEFDLITHDYELLKRVFRDVKNESFASIMNNLSTQLSFLYPNFSYGSTTIYRKINDSFQSFCNLYRQQFNAIININYTTIPATGKIMGLMNGNSYANAITRPGRYNHDHPDIRLLEYKYISTGITRSEVAGGYNQDGQVRRVYVGGNEDEGIRAITIHDPKIMNDTECLELATNRFNMFGGYKWYIKIRVKNHGALPIGQKIWFQWFEPDRNIDIPFKEYLIVDWEPYDVRNDVADIWITDGTITLAEFLAAGKSTKRDDELTGTYYDASVQSTTNSVPVVQNPVGRLTAGVFVWRTPEPTAWDYTIATLPNNTNWNTLNLQSIVPTGAKAVIIHVQYNDNLAGGYWRFRKFGQTGNFQYEGRFVTSNNFVDEGLIICGISEDGSGNRRVDFQANPSPSNWLALNIIILGWIL